MNSHFGETPNFRNSVIFELVFKDTDFRVQSMLISRKKNFDFFFQKSIEKHFFISNPHSLAPVLLTYEIYVHCTISTDL